MAEAKKTAGKKTVDPRVKPNDGKKGMAKNEIATPVVRDDGKKVRKVGLSAPVYSLLGKEVGNLELPKELFGVKVNKALLAQAMRVYMNNRKGHNSNTKTRGEVTGSTRKIYAQKGTGRARHGGIRAPIFVGGGIALGPKYRKTVLELPQKMKKASLISALSFKALNGEILGLEGIGTASGKTKEMMGFVSNTTGKQGSSKKQKHSMLIVGDKNIENVQRGVRNIEGVDFMGASEINVFEVIRHESLVLTREAVEKLQKRLSSPESSGPASSVSLPAKIRVGPPSSLHSHSVAGVRQEPSSLSPVELKKAKTRKGVVKK